MNCKKPTWGIAGVLVVYLAQRWHTRRTFGMDECALLGEFY
jgi:hypothetical protein